MRTDAQRARERAYYWAHRAKYLERQRRYREKLRGTRNEYARQYRRTNIANIQAGRRLSRYGLTKEMFAEYLDAQEGACALCGEQLPELITDRRLVVDHDHTTGAIRGLVHSVCNTAIGFFEKYRGHLDGYLAATNG